MRHTTWESNHFEGIPLTLPVQGTTPKHDLFKNHKPLQSDNLMVRLQNEVYFYKYTECPLCPLYVR
jgi:hypothetical protein